MNLISLPEISEISVENYSLFKEDFNYKFKSGLNLFIGANGLGKTTTTSLIIFGLIGFTSPLDKKFKIDTDYFASRATVDTDISPPSVEIIFSVKENKFSVKRNLITGDIIHLIFNGSDYDINEYDDLILLHTNISDKLDIAILLEFLLIREEEGNYLLWDFQQQSHILQILITDIKFRAKYQKAFNEFSSYAIENNHFTDTNLSKPRKKLRELEGLKEEALKSKKSSKSVQDLNKELKIKIGKKDKLISEKKEVIKTIEYLISTLKKHEGDEILISAEQSRISDKIGDYESVFFSGIYIDDRTKSIYHKLKHYSICMFCNSTLNKETTKNIINKVERNHKCPVCESGLKKEESRKVDVEQLAIEINELEKEFNALKKREEKILEITNKKRIEIQTSNLNLDRITFELNEISLDILEIETKLKNLTSPEDKLTDYDIEIRLIKKNILFFEKELKNRKVDEEKLKSRITKLNNDLTKQVNSNLAEINKIFTNLSKLYFNESCRLEVASKKIPGTSQVRDIKQAYYVPYFDEKMRTMEKHCSTSQRIFLEYLFRLSLLKFYSSKVKFPPFLVLETSEGAFDLSSTKQLGNSFVSFKNDPLKLILITNFSKPDFLKILAKGTKSKKSILNYLDFCRLNNGQLEDIKQYTQIITDVISTK